MSEKQVLIVEDEQKIADLLRDYLQQSGFKTHCIERGDEVVSWVKEQRPDFVLLDIMLPAKDGMSVCRDIRTFSNVPVIMITARVEEIDRLLGLELGADDYICKPFSAREVVVRVKAVLRRMEITTAEADADYRGIKIDEQGFIASVESQVLELTPVEFRILKLLTASPGRVFSRDALIDAMYLDGRIVSDRTVDSHVKNLRRKLVAATGDEDWIRSIYGVGYRID